MNSFDALGVEYTNGDNNIGLMDRIETPLDLNDGLVEQIILPENIVMNQEGKVKNLAIVRVI